jgi:chaperonin GroES
MIVVVGPAVVDGPLVVEAPTVAATVAGEPLALLPQAASARVPATASVVMREMLATRWPLGGRLRRVAVMSILSVIVADSGKVSAGVGPDVSADTLRPVAVDAEKLPIKMLNDRVLVRIVDRDGERSSSGGIIIPATAQMAKRLIWAEVVALGQNVRSAEVGDRVLFSPDDRYEVEVGGTDYVMLRERDLHAVAAARIEQHTGLYL